MRSVSCPLHPHSWRLERFGREESRTKKSTGARPTEVTWFRREAAACCARVSARTAPDLGVAVDTSHPGSRLSAVV